MTEANKCIDIEKIFREKNPRLARFIPRLLMNYIRKIIHEDEVNDFLHTHGGKMNLEFVQAGIQAFKVKVASKGTENIPSDGGFIIAGNHPLGGLDAFALMQEVSKKRMDIKFIVNDILMQLKNMQGLFIGVNKHGKNAQENLLAIDALYASDSGVFIFPAGLVSRKQNGIIKDLPWQKSFITKAKKHHRNIIPVHVEGHLTKRFYNFANLRAALNIKSNIEMFFLADELFKQENKTISITFGKPISYTVFDKTKTDFEWAQWVKERVYSL